MKGPDEFKYMKDFILSAYCSNAEINDSCKKVQILFHSIENILRLGLKPRGKSLDYWNWLESLIPFCKAEKIFLPQAFFNTVNLVRRTSSVTTNQGRGRLLLRALVNCGLIEFPIQLAMTNPKSVVKFYEANASVLANEILVHIFSSLISTLSKINFRLNVENAEFLDDTWSLPVFRQYELVPCQELGLRITQMDGHLVVVDIDPCGVAAEDSKIEVGDILVTMYSRALRNLSAPLASLRKSNEGKPTPVHVVKAKQSDGRVFPAIASLLRSHQSVHLVPSLFEEENRLEHSRFQAHPKCRVLYIGQCSVGSDGGMHMINQSINRVLQASVVSSFPQPVHIELGELGVTVWPLDRHSGEVVTSDEPLFRHPYPKISSCGRRVDSTNYLAYIACDSPGVENTSFRCLVFEAIDKQESKNLIANISQGFERTHWAL